MCISKEQAITPSAASNKSSTNPQSMEFGITVERMNELEEKSLLSILLAMNIDSY